MRFLVGMAALLNAGGDWVGSACFRNIGHDSRMKSSSDIALVRNEVGLLFIRGAV